MNQFLITWLVKTFSLAAAVLFVLYLAVVAQ